MGNSRRIIKNSVAQAFAFGAKSVVTMVIYFIIARTDNGPELLGNFVILVTLSGLFAFISTFGLAELLARELARIRDDLSQIRSMMNAAIGLVITLSILAGGLMLLTSMVIGYRGDMLLAALFTVLSLALESIVHVMRSAFNGVEEMERSSAITTTIEVSFLIIGVLVLALHADIVWLMVAYAVARIIGLLMTFRLYHSRFGLLHPTFDKARWRILLKLGLPFSLNYVLSQVYVRLDVIILTFFVSTAVVGLYESSTGLTIRLNIIARTINLAMLPFLAWKHSSDDRSINLYTARAIHYLVIIGFPCAAVLFLFSKEIILLLYGDQFLLAVDALRLLALIVPLRMIDNTLATALTASDRQVQRTTAITAAAVVNVVINFVLIPLFGMMGAVFATMVTEVLLLSLLSWYMRHELRDIFQWQIFTAPVFGVALMVLASILLPISLWIITSLVSVFLYIFAIFAADRSTYFELSALLLGQKK